MYWNINNAGISDINGEVGPRCRLEELWVSLDVQDNHAVSELDELEELVISTDFGADAYVNEIVYRIRICQTAYYTARSLGLKGFFAFVKAAPKPNSLKEIQFPESDPVHGYRSGAALFAALQLNTEAFYFSAFRIVELTRNKACAIPKIEPKGVIEVRNNIIQHGEPGISFNWQGDAFTLVLNGGKPLKNGFVDPGMASNCCELIQSLKQAVARM